MSFLFSCNSVLKKEVGRLQINMVSTKGNLIIKETNLGLKRGDVVEVWSDVDVKYEGVLNLLFRIQILKNEENIGVLEIDPIDKTITINEIKTSLLGNSRWSFQGKNSEIKIEEDGDYTFKGLLVSNTKNLLINKAEIVLKK
jgi:hypothetical protein